MPHVMHADYSRMDRCQRSVTSFDLYKQPFRLLLPDGKNEYRTCTGALMSISTLLVVLLYATYKITILVSNESYLV